MSRPALAIVGYDDIRFAAMSFVPLTSVRMPAYELGYQATKLLLDEATNGARRSHEWRRCTAPLRPWGSFASGRLGLD